MFSRRLQTSAQPSSAPTNYAASVSQYGVTYTFDQPYPVGQFVNGDWFVCPISSGGSVTITSITPDYNATQTTNGFQINLASMSAQGYDGRGVMPDWNAGLVPSLPLAVSGGSSIVKGVSATDPGGVAPDQNPSLQTAVVLTVLDAPPAQPAITFRPPYYGTYKPLYTLSDLAESRLPTMAPVGSPPSLTWIRGRFQRVQLDHYYDWEVWYMHPADNFRPTPGSGQISNYGGVLARDNNDAILRLMLNDATWSQKQAALVNVLQAGIDWFGITNSGGGWIANGGHSVGRKQMVFFAAMMFDSAEMKSAVGISTEGIYSENDFIVWGTPPARPLWGFMGSDPNAYWNQVTNGIGRRDLADPTGQIDGGYSPGAGYQAITSNTFVSAALIVHLMNGSSVWANDNLLDYADRWNSFGAWTQPDTETANRPAFWSVHGTDNRTTYGTSFQQAMWTAYR